MGECLTDEQLELLVSGVSLASETAPLRAHVSQCPVCRKLLAEWEQNLNFEETVRQVLSAGGDATVRLAESPPRPASGAFIPGVPGYQILHSIHRGSQGVVYYGVQESTQRPVAIKFLREGAHASGDMRRRFEREIELVRALKHPNIIEIFDSGTSSDGHLYYVMDYVRGLPLHRYVWAGNLDLEDTLRLFATVCDAVNFAHRRGVIHRDLKPSNILVDAEGVPRVLDFGLAKQLTETTGTFLSTTGQVMGTIPYMSPEQARGEHDTIDIRTDVYTLGVILYLILTGRYPYPTVGPIADVLNHIVHTPPLPPTRGWTSGAGVGSSRSRSGRRGACPIDDEVETIILRALAKDPERRYPNVAALHDDITRYLAGQPIEARREAGIHVLRKSLARYRAAVLVASISVVLTSVFSITLWGMYQNLQRERDIAQTSQDETVRVSLRFSGVMTRQGDEALARGDLTEALGHYLGALGMNQNLAAMHPTNLQRQGKVAESHLRAGLAMDMAGDRDSAYFHYGQAHRLAERLVATSPQNPLWRDLLALCCQRLGAVAAELGNNELAEDCAEKALRLRHELAHLPTARPEMIVEHAWLLLTVVPPERRDPSRALQEAERAVRATGQPEPMAVWTAALARSILGDREEAQRLAAQAAGLNGGLNPMQRLRRAEILRLMGLKHPPASTLGASPGEAGPPRDPAFQASQTPEAAGEEADAP